MLQIRPARYSDAEVAFDIRLQAIRHQCIAVYTPEQVQAWTQVPLTERYRARVERQYSIAWWGEVAVATGLIDFQTGELGALFVLPAFMGQGIGKAMIQYLERLALEVGLAEIHLDATPNATAFYHRCGYHGEVGGIYTSPSGLELACTPMHKRLVG
ncbi:GNAT family N-acetyltransferase [Pseudomonas sp. dw_358]|uniref:GNAT family N-acetyltransferase n=1 Tax=Pseudomonas sp. dw_358 TaxID=2720083 RepID=UPI001BD663F1|nr:GNAT family N-acetyltransferase [Pseudomonas sp. dw_358]